MRFLYFERYPPQRQYVDVDNLAVLDDALADIGVGL
jgi:hypothetical protein